ncbi:hypothetical protein EC957_010122 [Mortierella hygrophila]|uniref:Uncharacterized protein n=1 Tax=Mortierella hygrophila TaxID=979708 RepID=A0A9P6K4N0_9FUNG|nr:hypothetical protein EC957_010122 [Mortierella hygrophila]
MSQIRLRQLRKWMVFITTLNFLSMIAYYGYTGYEIEQSKKYGYNDGNLRWGDWTIIISAIGFFIFYILSLRGSGFQNVHKYLRTFLLLVPTIMVLYITCKSINLELWAHSHLHYQGPPFTCGDIGNYPCYLLYTNMFMALISALFVVIEIGATLAWGPLEKAHQFGGAQGGYVQNANVILVSPDQPYQQQQQYYSPQQQHQFQQQQQYYYPHMQQLQHPPQQPILIGPNVTQQQQPPQGPGSPLEHLPKTHSEYTQSPIAATATSGYQPSPQPSQPSISEHHPSSSPFTPAH